MRGDALRSEGLAFDVRLLFVADTDQGDIVSGQHATEVGEQLATAIQDALKEKFGHRDVQIGTATGRYRHDPFVGVIDITIVAGVTATTLVVAALQAPSFLRSILKSSLRRHFKKAVAVSRFRHRLRSRFNFSQGNGAEDAHGGRDWFGRYGPQLSIASVLLSALAVAATSLVYVQQAEHRPVLTRVDARTATLERLLSEQEQPQRLRLDTSVTPTALPEASPEPIRRPRVLAPCRRISDASKSYALVRCQ